MDLSKQVVSLEQAERLRELGVEQTGYFMWQETGNPDPTMPQETIGRYGREAYDNIGIASAFTVAELGVMLPDGADCFGKHWAQFQTFRVIKGVQPSQQWCCYCDESSPSGVNDQGDDYYKVAKKVYGQTEAQARAAMLIYLLENKLTTDEECNKRLTQ